MLAPGDGIPANWTEWIGANDLVAVGAQDVLVRHPVIVAGAETIHLSAILDADGSAFQLEQFYIRTDAQTYIVAFGFSSTVPLAERDALTQSVLASWVWT